VPAAHHHVSEGRLRTLGGLVVALLQQAPVGPASEGIPSVGILDRVATASLASKGVLLILMMLSILSWSIFLYKLWVFRLAGRQTVQFLDVFRRSKKLSEVQAVCRSLSGMPLVGLFQ